MANPAEKDPNKKPSKTTNRRAKAGWVVAVFFIAAWMFGMGIMVGRKRRPCGSISIISRKPSSPCRGRPANP